jgi:ABC-type glycerol-3-phosphate transport system permease component
LKVRISAGERVFDAINFVILSLFVFVCIYPFYYVLVGSVSSGSLSRYAYLWPINFTLRTYKDIFSQNEIYRAFFISISRTVLGTLLTTFFTSMLAHLLTKEKMYFRKFIYRYFIVTMYISAGLIPWYITMRTYGLQNNFLVYVVPGIVNTYYLILVKTFIESIPDSLEESAEIDGAGFFTVYTRIILPLIKPILATIMVYAAVGHWNTWQDNYFLVLKRELQTVQLMLYNYLQQAQTLAMAMRNATSTSSGQAAAFPVSPESIRMTMVVITVVPVMLVYPFLQKHFTSGIMLGAVKG